MADFNTVNLADIYGQIDNARANQAQQQAMQMRQQQMQYEMDRQRKQDAMQERVRGAYGGAMSLKDGVPTLDKGRLISSIYEADPVEALKLQQEFSQQDLAANKTKAETAKAELATKVEQSKYLRDRLAGVQDQASYDAVMQEAAEMGAGIVKAAPRQYNPKWVGQNLMGADDFIKKGEAELNRGVTMRGQDISMRGQDLSRDTAIRGQNMSASTAMRGQDLTNARGIQANQIAQNKALNPPKTALSSAAQKEVFEADEMVQASKNAIGMLQEAKKLNKTAYSGVGAKPRAIIASNLGLGSGGADDTVNLDNLMTGQALESLKATFGGMPTEGERKILLDIQASADKTPSQRAAILDRAEKAAERRIKFNESKAKALRGGTYFTNQPPTPDAPSNDVRSAADKILGL